MRNYKINSINSRNYNPNVKKHETKSEKEQKIETRNLLDLLNNELENELEREMELNNESDKNKIDIKIKIKTKNSRERRSQCPNCETDDNLINDTKLGVVICNSCGQVIENILDGVGEWRSYDDDCKESLIRCNGYIVSRLLPQSSLGTTIGHSNWKSRIQRLHKWSKMPYKERSLNDVFKLMDNVCSKACILKCVVDDAKIMYKAISESRHFTGKNKNKYIIIRGDILTGIIAACVYFACQRKGMTRSPKEIAKIFAIDYSDMTRGCKNFQKYIKNGYINLNTGEIRAVDFVKRYCKDNHITEQFMNDAVKIADNIIRMDIATIHTPISIASCSVLLMVEIHEITSITRGKLLEQFNISLATLVKTYEKTEKYKSILLDDAKVNEFIEKQNNSSINNVVPAHLIKQFRQFGIPTDPVELSKFTVDYSKIYNNKKTLLSIDDFDVDKYTHSLKTITSKYKFGICLSLDSPTKILY